MGGLLGTVFGGNPFQGVINQVGGQFSNENQQGNSLFGQGQNIQNQLTPFFQSEMTNPQGMGATTLNQMLTQSGQSIAGGVGGAKRTAMDLGARTGNTAAVPGIIGSAAKSGMVAQSGNANNIQIQNAMLKQAQQQQGAAGLSSLFSKDLSGSEGFEGLANSVLNTELSAKQDQYGAERYGAQNAMKGISSIGNMIATLIGQRNSNG